ncbi:hypothetical protein Tco_0793307 [Tanacetum coccineum]
MQIREIQKAFAIAEGTDEYDKPEITEHEHVAVEKRPKAHKVKPEDGLTWFLDNGATSLLNTVLLWRPNTWDQAVLMSLRDLDEVAKVGVERFCGHKQNIRLSGPNQTCPAAYILLERRL